MKYTIPCLLGLEKLVADEMQAPWTWPACVRKTAVCSVRAAGRTAPG